MKAAMLLITLALGILMAPLTTEAQPPAPVFRIAELNPSPAPGQPQEVFRQRLRDLGYVLGQTIRLEYRSAEWQLDRLPDLAAELVRLPADVLLALGPTAVRAATHATTTLPIVAIDLESDPVASGFIASLARPGENLTGVFLDFPDFAGKQLELLKDVVPQLSRVAVLWDPGTGPVQVRAVEAAAHALGVQLHLLHVLRPDELEGACRAATEARASALLALSSPLINQHQKQIADCALGSLLPAMMLFTGFAEDGGLLAYGPNLLDIFRKTGGFISKILNGAAPGNLPVERPAKFELVINLKT